MLCDPVKETAPIPWSILADVASTDVQVNVTDPPPGGSDAGAATSDPEGATVTIAV